MGIELIIGIAIDAIFALILLIAAIRGFKRGFLKTIRGIISAVIVIVIAYFVAVPVTDLIVQPSWKQGFGNTIESTLLSAVPFDEPNLKLHYILPDDRVPPHAGNPDSAVGLVFERDGIYFNFQTLVDEQVGKPNWMPQFIYRMVMNDVIARNATAQLREAEQTFAAGEGAGRSPHADREGGTILLSKALSETVAMYIFYAIAFIILTIIVQILWMILMRLLKKVVGAVYIAHAFNKIGGIFAGGAVALIIILIIHTILLVIARGLGVEPLMQGLESTYLTQVINENNFIFNFFLERGWLSFLPGINNNIL